MWKTTIRALECQFGGDYLDWLVKPYNLSTALKRVCTQLSVRILYQGRDVYCDDECQVLQDDASAQHCYVRQVILQGDDRPFCFARIVAPWSVYQQYQQQFDTLDGNLLGNTLLYSNSNTTRSPFEYQCIDKSHAYYACLDSNLSEPLPQGESLAARRSIFHMDGDYPLLVSEVFMPDIPAYPSQPCMERETQRY
ncbi:MAG: hypothetical protein COB66_00035 [Coxiella sp. (in: Bacteria)]|nr:MAG: hypothetical protein COB66_00035 [Coxiella sp. (in: g-proteobacteria)]